MRVNHNEAVIHSSPEILKCLISVLKLDVTSPEAYQKKRKVFLFNGFKEALEARDVGLFIFHVLLWPGMCTEQGEAWGQPTQKLLLTGVQPQSISGYTSLMACHLPAFGWAWCQPLFLPPPKRNNEK